MGRTRQEKMQIELRRTQVSDLFLKKWRQAAIARELGVSQATISNDLKAIRKEWMESRVRNYDEVITEENKSIEVVEREAWEAWRRSQEPAETTRIIQKNGERRAEKTVCERAGDPRFLRLVLSATENRHKLLGLDAAAKAALEKSDAQAIRDKQTLNWDLVLGRVGDDDYVERRLNEEESKEIADQASGGKTRKNALVPKDKAHSRPDGVAE